MSSPSIDIPLARVLPVVTMLFALAAAPSAARAVEDLMDAPDGESAAVKKAYRKAIKDGVAEYDDHHFEEALSYFRRAHQIYPNARTFRGIGMASFELRDYVAAVRNLRAALQEERKPLSAEQRKETEDLLERCKLFVAVYTLRISPPDAQVTIDANPIEREPDGTLMMGLGTHTVDARATGYRKRSLSVQVRGGERKELELNLEAVNSRPLVAASVPMPVAAGPEAKPPRKSNSLLWFLAGGGAAAIAAGAGAYWANQAAELSSCRHPPAGVGGCKNESDLATSRTVGAVTTIVAGAAAVTLVTVGILSLRSKPEEPKRKADLACYPGLLSLTCARAF
jgi:tetratricopeptide (TPR) repeat protein